MKRLNLPSRSRVRDWIRGRAGLPPPIWLLLLLLLSCAGAQVASAAVETTLHDFGLPRPGESPPANEGVSRMEEAPGACIFCHTPHNAQATRGLWNRRLPPVNYDLYESPTLVAELKQPTGASRLCLSCHDGTLAMGALRVAPRALRENRERIRGRASLGTDLSDDHPISFVYDQQLMGRRGELADPNSLPRELRLDLDGQMQCTTCHDPHEDRYRQFLVVDDRDGRLCTTCHLLRGWRASAHAISTASVSASSRAGGLDLPFDTVAENACESCHQQHDARHPQWLLRSEDPNQGCLGCHDGGVAASNVTRPFGDVSIHPIEITSELHSPGENPLLMQRHVACPDCHEPHSTGSTGGAGVEMERLGRIDGVDSAGTWVPEARSESEVCYKCHGLYQKVVTGTRTLSLIRADDETNVRLEFNSQNTSFHPVESTGRDQAITGLRAGYNPSSRVTCTDCHDSNDSSAAGGQGARGPHGSIYEPILVRQYEVADQNPESYQEYALCYECHDRQTLLADGSGFPHRQHVVDEQTPCAVCHDAHGARKNPFLINFLVRGRSGTEIVTPATGGRLKFESSGRGSGRCFLSCHGVDHDPAEYPDSGRSSMQKRFR